MKKHQNRQNPSDQGQRKKHNLGPLMETPVRNPGPAENGGPVPSSRDSNVQQESQSHEFRFLGFVFPKLISRNWTFIGAAMMNETFYLRDFRFYGLDIVSYFHDLGDHGDIDD